MTATDDNAAAALDEDVPCKRCGYDLRGLTPPARCPECAFDVGESVRAHALRSLHSPPPDGAWARRLREGAWLSVMVFGMVLANMLAPEVWTYPAYRNAPLWRTAGRVVLLSIAAAWWVLAWASAWRLTTRERPRPPGAGPGVWAVAARVLATVNLLAPFVWAWGTWSRQYPAGLPAVVLVGVHFCGLGGAAALLVRIGQLFRRLGWRIAFVESLVLALAVPASVFYGLSVGNRGPSSLSMMSELPVYPFGLLWVFGSAIHELLWWDWFDPLAWLYILLPLWTLSLLVRLIVAYRRSIFRPAASPGPRNPASSPG